jgi:hypothetical protein
MNLIVFAYTWWFGWYLLQRNPKKLGLRYSALGLISYAVGIFVVANTPQSTSLRVIPILLPSLFWVLAIWHLPNDDTPPQTPQGVMGILAVWGVLVALLNESIPQLLAFTPILLASVSFFRLRHIWQTTLPKHPLITLFTATLFFVMGSFLLVVPFEWLSHDFLLLMISGDLFLLGLAIAYLDAYDEGVTLWWSALRSFTVNTFVVGIVGAQWLLGMAIMPSDEWQLLGFGIMASVIVVITCANTLQGWLDQWLFVDKPTLQQERQLLRDLSEALPEVGNMPNFHTLSGEEFTRLTRTALRHYNDLSKLATSPLTQLPIVTQRLRQNGQRDQLLERTHTLKYVLHEAILSLKPYSDADFAPNDAWRYYNVLYFPYVVGLKPFSATQMIMLDNTAQEALVWFQTHVPERTLHNWQTTATKLIAQQLQQSLSEKMSIT